MKRTRKGFTLVELMIVIGIIGILGAMGIIGGSEANSIAQANKIIEEFRIIGSAMNLYYSDNRAEVEKKLEEGETLPKKIKAGIAAYMKNTDMIEDTTASEGKYLITVTKSAWWLSYKLPETNSKVAQILANKASSERLRNVAVDEESTTTGEGESATTTNNLYTADKDTVYTRVR